MKQELEDKLMADFPLLYRPHEDCNQMLMFGFECGDGWYGLIRELSEKLTVLIKSALEDPDVEAYDCPYPFAIQVKEKYGKLRFYMSWSTDVMDDLIESYENQSEYVCETCGKPGSINYGEKWLEARCEVHQ